MNETPTALLRRLMPFLLRHSQSVSPLLFVNKALGSAPATIYVRQQIYLFFKTVARWLKSSNQIIFVYCLLDFNG